MTPRERRYVVIEFMDAWAGHIVTARSKAEAIAKVREGNPGSDECESWSGSGGPIGKYRVTEEAKE